jgi:hypothetical protein
MPCCVPRKLAAVFDAKLPTSLLRNQGAPGIDSTIMTNGWSLNFATSLLQVSPAL